MNYVGFLNYSTQAKPSNESASSEFTLKFGVFRSSTFNLSIQRFESNLLFRIFFIHSSSYPLPRTLHPKCLATLCSSLGWIRNFSLSETVFHRENRKSSVSKRGSQIKAYNDLNAFSICTFSFGNRVLLWMTRYDCWPKIIFGFRSSEDLLKTILVLVFWWSRCLWDHLEPSNLDDPRLGFQVLPRVGSPHWS